MEKLALNAYDLATKLSRHFGKKFDSFAIGERIEGTLNNKNIYITYKSGEYLLLSVSHNHEELLTELTPLMEEMATGTKPICRYLLQGSHEKEEDARPTIEWDMKDPEKRLIQVVNGRAFSKGAKLHNLTLFGSRKIEDYIDTPERRLKREQEEHIYGIYPGIINPSLVKDYSEVDLWLNIDALSYHIWRCKHDIAKGRIASIDLTEEEYGLEYLAYQTTRFGVDLPKPELDKHIIPTPSYFAWNEFYRHHFKEVLSEAEWNAFIRIKNAKGDISSFLPKGDWHSLMPNNQSMKKVKRDND